MNKYTFVFPKQNNSCLVVYANNFAEAVFFVREMCDLVDAQFNAIDCTISVGGISVNGSADSEEGEENGTYET